MVETRSTKRLGPIGLRGTDPDLNSTCPSAGEESLISRLPDECLLRTFRFLSGFEHGLVSIHWLHLAREALLVLPVKFGSQVKMQSLLPDFERLLRLYPNLQTLQINSETNGLFGDGRLISIIGSFCPNLLTLRVANEEGYGTKDYFSLPCLTSLVQTCQQLKKLSFSLDPDRAALPPCIAELKQLEELSIMCEGDKDFLSPELFDETSKTLRQLRSLKHLSIDQDSLVSFPPSICSLTLLESLKLASYSVTCLPSSIGDLTNLKRLVLDTYWLESLPESLTRLTRLEELEVDMQMDTVPRSLYQLPSLTSLKWSADALVTLPADFHSFRMLQVLSINEAYGLTTLHDSFGDLPSLTDLTFANCDSLERLPDSFVRLRLLTALKFDECPSLTELPFGFGALQALKSLAIFDCESLRSLPPSLLLISSLRRVELEDLPAIEGLEAFCRKFKETVVVTVDGAATERLLEAP